jgi:RNase adaptor protein for sRNA GlmZ degradation
VAPSFVILTGASGSGKTSLARQVQRRYPLGVDVFFFDSIGVPPAEQMVRDFGSGEAWQRAMTQAWIARISQNRTRAKPTLFEGQMRIAFVSEALGAAGVAEARIILVDCNDDVRVTRLKGNRNQPELADTTMMNWAKYLRREAQAAGIDILDTERLSMAQCTELICHWLGLT